MTDPSQPQPGGPAPQPPQQGQHPQQGQRPHGGVSGQWGPPSGAPWSGAPQPPRQMGWSLSNPDPPRQEQGHTAAAPYPGQPQQPGHPQQPGQPQQPSQPPYPGPVQGSAPLGQQPQAPVSIDQYAMPRSNARWWLALVAVLVAVALGVAAWFDARPAPPEPPVVTPSTSGSTPSKGPTAIPSGNSAVFYSELDDAEGVWQIQKSTWTDRGLELTVHIKVTRGTFNYSFFALDNATTEDYTPAPIEDADALRPGTMAEGETVTGTIVFDKPRGATMVYLANGFGRQVSALSAKA